ncbi:MAG: hypothetical protein DI622_08265 [Chryseobacterium sp.]|uniref:NUMOD4 domain-containing protein n=1 Tax=Chryseobacterium sp. TaxID=1871047 RepID=UPI000DB128EE|nr:NUMOD4 domain-containing protein [Chryseobacterium sp.]MPS64236.1 hypothetical protein [Chryseobacterium sp.]PZU20169.1 MAG: hypothetical protein DI622_08265 [Chryseobacterium sp.]
MNLPAELEDQYVKEVLYNTSLQNLQDEEWKFIEGFENYEISNYGRLKSKERTVPLPYGNENRLPEKIMKLIFVKHFNKYLQSFSYNVHCTLSLDGEKYRKSVARLVYYHFIEKFNWEDRTISISTKDGNRLHLHSSNLQKVSASERSLTIFSTNRARNRNVIYQQPVSQYSVEGVLLATFDSMYEVENKLNIHPECIMDVINKEFLTAGGFRWFLSSYTPTKEDFVVNVKSNSSDKVFNSSLWKTLGKPKVNKKSPPPCMNLSLQDLPGELWKPIPNFEKRFLISNKGRIKRLSGWTTTGRKIFLQEQILSQFVSTNQHKPSLYSLLNHNGKMTSATITKMLYHCFVKEFDLYGNKYVVVNKSNFFWDIDISKLSLHSIHAVLKGKIE